MKISLLAGIVLGIALLLVSLGMLANLGIIAKPLSPQDLAQKQIEELKADTIPTIVETTSLELPEQSIDFGIHEEGISVDHVFKFKNVGKSLLKITRIKPSCGCLKVSAEELSVPPGETGEITVTIDTTNLSGPVNDKFLVARSNDPSQGEMTIPILAVVTVPLEITPPRIVFSRLEADQTVSRDLKVFTQLGAPFEITGARMLRPDIEKFFDITYRPLEPSEVPEGAKSGWNITATVKPGLPTGNFKQVVSLETSVEKMPTVNFDLEGSVVNDISVVAIGEEFNPKFNLLSLGAIKQDVGAKVKLKMLVVGEFRDTLEVGTPVCEPDFLRATIGERTSINNGSASEFPIEIEIPPGSPIVSMLGNERQKDAVGRVLIPTNHSSMKEVKILLHFAVEK